MLACCRLGPCFCRQTHKINTNGRDVALCVCVVGETQEQARLSDTRVTDEEELEEVVVSVVQRNRQRELRRAGETAPRLCVWRRLLCRHSCQHNSRDRPDSVVPRPVAVGLAGVTYYSGFILAVLRGVREGLVLVYLRRGFIGGRRRG
jgi:hypothetical protein